MRRQLAGILVLGTGIGVWACGSETDGNEPASTGGMGAAMTGGAVGTGSLPGTGGLPTGGLSGVGGFATGGANPTGGMAGTGGDVGGANTGGGGANTGGGGVATGGQPPTLGDGPCDIFEDAGTPCVAAYSMVRVLSSTYTGPLYQVRSGSNPENTGSGGQTHDIGATADGFADKAAHDAACAGTLCTISLLFDQSGRGNDLPTGTGGRTDGGQWASSDDFESIADAGPLTVAGHDVYSLYMDARQGYRSPLNEVADGMPLHQEPQGIYMLADGTHYGSACCWDFGNVSPDPKRYGVMNTLFFGVAYWGRGEGGGPWFMADYEAGVWAGGTRSGDPGWGGLNDAVNAPPNTANPSLRVPFAIGFLKTNQTDWSLRMADLAASSLTTAYQGGLPKQMANEGGIVLGVGGDNSNNSWGTFFEGAIVAGYPGDDVEQAVMQNVKDAGY